jgi:carbon storage regulator
MLMLSRSPGKAIIIGGNIRVYVAQVVGLQVRLGIDAPKGVVVDREEIHARRTVESEARLAGRTEAEWRQLLIDEAAEQADWNKVRKLLDPSAATAAGQAKSAPAFNIDEHVRMVADARRYRLLRDRECIEDPTNDLLVLRGDTYLTGEDLDREVDAALRLEALEQQS